MLLKCRRQVPDLCGAILMARTEEAASPRPHPTGHASLVEICAYNRRAINRFNDRYASDGGIKSWADREFAQCRLVERSAAR